jgi:ABC-type xylose transport system permease subunit
MTYRSVPPRWRLIAQLATLGVSAMLGVYIVYIGAEPSVDPRLSQIEKAMSAAVWGYALASLGVVGLIAEILNNRDVRERLFWLVSLCHILLFGIMMAFAASALVGVILNDSKLWASVMLSFYLALMNFIYIQRKPRLSNGAPK